MSPGAPIDRRGGRGRCSICDHPHADAIDRALLRETPLARLEKKFGVTGTSLRRHKKAHTNPALKAVRQERRKDGARSALEEAEAALTDVKRRLAESGTNFGQAMVAHRELRGHLTLYAKLSGELDERPSTVINIETTAEWVRTRTALLLALIPFPDATRAVSDALAKLAKA